MVLNIPASVLEQENHPALGKEVEQRRQQERVWPWHEGLNPEVHLEHPGVVLPHELVQRFRIGDFPRVVGTDKEDGMQPLLARNILDEGRVALAVIVLLCVHVIHCGLRDAQFVHLPQQRLRAGT